MAEALHLSERFIHLELGATAVPQPAFDGLAWYDRYGERHAADGIDGRLVSMYTFTQGRDSWEMHPLGSEVVICTAGRMVLTQEHADGRSDTVVLSAGDYAINPPGVWHIADVADTATAVFITAGEGTQHRPR